MEAATIRSSQQGNATVVTIQGPLSAGGGDLKLRAEIAEALYRGARRIVVDFGGLTALDSSGLGELVRAAGAAARADGRLAFARCPKNMLDLLAITKVTFNRVVFADSVEAAIEALE